MTHDDNWCPKIVTAKLGTDGEVKYYHYFTPLLFGEDALRPRPAVEKVLQNLLNSSGISRRVQVILEGTAFLAAVFPAERRVLLCGPGARQELFLLEHVESIEPSPSENFILFKGHVSAVVSLKVEDFPAEIEVITKLHQLPDIFDLEKNDQLIHATGELIQSLLQEIKNYRSSFFEKLTDYGLALSADSVLIRIHLLKFLAILPSLDFDEKGHEVKRILLESLRRLLDDSRRARMTEKKNGHRPLARWMFHSLQFAGGIFKLFPPRFLAAIIRSSVKALARRFIVAESIDLAAKGLRDLGHSLRDATLDQLGELVVSENEADHYKEKVLEIIRGLKSHYRKGEKNAAGINRAHVSIKVSALASDFKPQAFEYTYSLVAPRLREILLAAQSEEVFIHIDAEHFHHRDVVFSLYQRVLRETPELRQFDQTGIVVQAYLKDAHQHLQEVIALARERKLLMPIRLVKGAYWDAETIEARASEHRSYQFVNKVETDLHFRQLVVLCLENGDAVQLCLASHNFTDHAFSEALRASEYPQAPMIEHQCLHMTYEALSVAMAKRKWAVRNYIPIGSLLVGMAYLVRRIMENSSQAGVLSMMRSHRSNLQLESPGLLFGQLKGSGKWQREAVDSEVSADFANVAPLRLHLKAESDSFSSALKRKKSELGEFFANPWAPEGEEESVFSSSDQSLKVGSIFFLSSFQTREVVEKIYQNYLRHDWSSRHWSQRAARLLAASFLLTARRNSLAALIVFEAGKSWHEALADVDEAIDFLNFYARDEGLWVDRLQESYERGVVAVIAPWNFPLAILCGMSAAALVSGNSVVVKSAEQTPLIAQVLIDIFYEAGVPPEVLAHVPGRGEEVGQCLVDSEQISTYVFTGSRAIGEMIYKTAGQRFFYNEKRMSRYPVKVVAEMGGKNAIIVTANAELDETVAAILYSAFSHAGQKCSACSRLIVDQRVSQKLAARLTEAMIDLNVGSAEDPSVSMNPVITLEDQKRLRALARQAVDEASGGQGEVYLDRSKEEFPGLGVGPVFIGLNWSKAQQRESFFQREIFGPVIHLVTFNGLEQAIEIFNATDYALTGGIFSQSQDDVDFLSARMKCGNLYINRSITGARVLIEPFGGFKKSGTGPKAGGQDYLGAFHQIVRPVEFDEMGEEAGSNHPFELCGPSRNAPRVRAEKMTLALNKILASFVTLFPNALSAEKRKWELLREWIENTYPVLAENPVANRKIPGQWGFNDYSQCAEQVVYLEYSLHPQFDMIFQALVAVTCGSGVSILVRNQGALEWWRAVRQNILSSGILPSQFDVFYATEEQLEMVIQDAKVSVIIINGNEEKMHKVSSLALGALEQSESMKKIITCFEACRGIDFELISKNYRHVRSFAVNTMRHGAPLDLEPE